MLVYTPIDKSSIVWDFEHGLQCRSSHLVNLNFRNIGNLDLIEKRKHRIVPIPPSGTLSDYVPFYFTSRSPMLYNIKTGHGGIPRVPMADIIIYVARLRELASNGASFVFTDRHAKLEMAAFSNDLADLNRIDWQLLQDSDFRYDSADPGKMDRYQAEALIHHDLPCSSFAAILCFTDNRKSEVADLARRHGVTVPVLVRPEAYFV